MNDNIERVVESIRQDLYNIEEFAPHQLDYACDTLLYDLAMIVMSPGGANERYIYLQDLNGL